MVSESDFRLVEAPIPDIGEGEVLVRAAYLTVDPYMRGRMRERKSYAAPIGIGEVMTGGVVGRVERSRNQKYSEGEVVSGTLGWQEFAASDGKDLRKLDGLGFPPSAALHILGMPGLTAYFGFLEVCRPQVGDTVVVSGAAGAVGSAVGQIAKIKGCRVIGVAGSAEKIAWITDELGFDAAFNYKTTKDLDAELERLCPDGVNCYYDNVGGPVSDAVFTHLAVHARVAICGQIAHYNEVKAVGPRILWNLITTRSTVRGLLVFDFAAKYAEGYRQLSEWLRSGQIKYRESIVDGFENAPKAFVGLFKGSNIGKQLVRISKL